MTNKKAISSLVPAGPPRLYKTGSALSARLVGANIYDLLLSDNYSTGIRRLTSAEVTHRLDAAVKMGSNVVRTHAFISLSQVDSLMPSLGSYNEAAFVALDYIMLEARRRNLWIWAPMVDMWNYYHGGAITWGRLIDGTTNNTDDYYRNVFFTNTTAINAFKNYLTTILTRVNTYTGIRYADDPTLAVIENINEGYSAPIAWTNTIMAHLRSIAPNTLLMDGVNSNQSRHPDGSNTEGYSTAGYNSLTVDCDIVGGHFYNDRDGGYLNRDSAMAAAANKAYVVGEWGWVDSQNGNTAVIMGGLSRSQFLARLEADPNVSGDMFWSIVTDPTNNVHDDGYQLFVPPLNAEQIAGMNDLTLHAQRMKAKTGKQWLTSTVNSAFSDTFPTAGTPDSTKWYLGGTYGTGASVTVSGGAMQFASGTSGNYSGLAHAVSLAPFKLNRRIRYDLTPANITTEAYWRTHLRAQSTSSTDGADGYVLEIGNSGSWNMSVIVGGTKTVLGPAPGSTSVPGWAAGVSVSIELEVVGSTINLRMWLTSGTRPTVPTWSYTNQQLRLFGATGLALNNGSAATSVTYSVKNYTISDYPDADSDGATVYQPGMLLMSNAAGTIVGEPYSDANAPESLSMTVRSQVPPSPPTGQIAFYSTDGQALMMKDASGTIRTVGGNGSKVSALAASTTMAATDVFPAVVGGATRKVSLDTVRQSMGTSNASISALTFNAADTYVAGAQCAIPSGRLKAGSRFWAKLYVSKTAAGTATPIISIRVGTNGTISDTAVLTLTFAAQTAVADEGIIDIYCTFRAVGTSAIINATGGIDHKMPTAAAAPTGLAAENRSIRNATSATFNSSAATFIGISVNPGTSGVWTCQMAAGDLSNLA